MKYLKKSNISDGSEVRQENRGTLWQGTLPHIVYSPMLRMHKAWRHYKELKLSNPDVSINTLNPNSHANTTNNTTTATTALWQSRLDNHRYCNNNQDITNNNINYYSSDDMTTLSFNALKLTQPLVESDPNSISSDHSELNEFQLFDFTSTTSLTNKQHNDNFNKIIHTLNQSKTNDTSEVENDPKKNRKTNLLNIANEFAALKRLNSRVLPFNLHQELYREVYGENLSDNDEIMTPHEETHISRNDDVNINDFNNNVALVKQANNVDEESLISLKSIVKDKTLTNLKSPLSNDNFEENNQVDTITTVHNPNIITKNNTFTKNSVRTRGDGGCENNDDENNERVVDSKESNDTISNNANITSNTRPETNTEGAAGCKEGRESITKTTEESVITINENGPSVNLRNKGNMSRSSSNIQLRDGQEEKKKIWWHRLSTREEILKKLAFEADEDNETPNTVSGLCYLNEAATDLDKSSNNPVEVKNDVKHRDNELTEEKKVEKVDSISEATIGGVNYLSQTISVEQVTPDIIASTNDVAPEDFACRQERLQREAKMALAQARPMAYMQLQLEKKKVTKSPLADIAGMEAFVEGHLVKLAPCTLQSMNIAQLQVVVNELHARIEVLNSDLMSQLVNRDDLHTVQDSMLVDIEDLTGRAQEFAARIGKRKV